MKEKYQIILDPNYGFHRVHPLPTQEEVEKYYQAEFYSNQSQRFNDSALKVQKEEEEFFNNRWESIYRKCKNLLGPEKQWSLFDVGFGYAQALKFFRKKGVVVSGLEPSSEGYNYAISEGLNVYWSAIEDFDCVGEQRFDVVTLVNVLEHLRQPAETLINIKNKLLRPGGILVVDVPNDFNDFQRIADSEYQLNQWWVCPPIHLNYFSTDSLKQLFIKCGFTVKHYEATFPLELFMLLGDVYVGNSALGKTCHNKRVKFEYLMKKYGKEEKLHQLYRSLAELNLGRQIVMYAQG